MERLFSMEVTDSIDIRAKTDAVEELIEKRLMSHRTSGPVSTETVGRLYECRVTRKVFKRLKKGLTLLKH